MATDETIRRLEPGVGALRRRPIKIVVTVRSSQIPVAASPVDANLEHLATPRQLGARHNGGQEVEFPEGRELKASPEGLDPSHPRRLGWIKAHRTDLVTGGATLGSAGTLLPAMVTHGSAQLALATGAGALLSLVVTNIGDRVRRGREAS